MSRLFWLLLYLTKGGYRYLRTVMRLAAGLVSRLGQAPGSESKAPLEPDTAMDAGMIARSAADGKLDARTGGGLLGRMVAWLVSVAYPKLLAGIALLTTNVTTAPGAGMQKDARAEVALTDEMAPAPGTPGAASTLRADEMDAGAGTAPPVPTESGPEADTILTAGSGTGEPVPGGAGLTVPHRLTAGAGESPSVPILGRWPQGTGLTAHMMTWSGPEWVDGKTLYIRQVYSTERDGDTLILH